jgi:hypothetical protein
METEFIVWFNNGTTIKKPNFEEATAISHFNYIIKAIPLKICSKGYIKCRYEFFDENGSSTKIRVENFELIDIVEDDYNSYNKDLIFYDTKRHITYKKRINGTLSNIFSKHILDFLIKVNDLGSFEIINLIEANESLKKEVKAIKKLLLEKETTIEELKDKITKI